MPERPRAEDRAWFELKAMRLCGHDAYSRLGDGSVIPVKRPIRRRACRTRRVAYSTDPGAELNRTMCGAMPLGTGAAAARGTQTSLRRRYDRKSCPLSSLSLSQQAEGGKSVQDNFEPDLVLIKLCGYVLWIELVYELCSCALRSDDIPIQLRRIRRLTCRQTPENCADLKGKSP